MRTLQDQRRYEGLRHFIGPYWANPLGRMIVHIPKRGFRPATDIERFRAAQGIVARQQDRYPDPALYCPGCEECR